MRALVRFHLRVGARLALRAAAPLAGLPFVAALVQQDPAGAVRDAAGRLLGPARGPAPGVFLVAFGLALASWAAPRVTAGLGGWPRHLPVSAVTHRRAALVALVMAQAPVVVALALLAPAAASQPGGLSFERLAALPVLLGAAAVAAWPGTHAWRSRPLALLALAGVAWGRTVWLPAALLLVAAAERLAGPLPAHVPPAERSALPLPLPLLVAARALGSAALAALGVSLLPVAAMALFRANNELTPGVAAGAARFGCGVGVVLLLAGLAERLAVRRPVWPWSRSLPVSAAGRVGEDALLLGVPCLVPLAAAAALDPLAALAVAACLPTLALMAAGALRVERPADSGVVLGLLGPGALLAAWVAVLPGLAVAALVAFPLARRAAARRERRQKVGRWDERHHQAVGDPLSWSAR